MATRNNVKASFGDEPSKPRRPMDKQLFETLKQVSPAAFASSIYSAAINKDVASLSNATSYLMGITDGKTNDKSLDGKSMLGRAYECMAFKHDGASATLSKEKTYITGLLFTPLAQMSSDDYRSEISQEYSANLFKMLKLLKVNGLPLASGLETMLTGRPDAPIVEVSTALIEAGLNAVRALNVISEVNHTLHRAAMRVDRSSKPQRIGSEVVELLLNNERCCAQLVNDAKEAADFYSPSSVALINHCNKHGLPKSVPLKDHLIEIYAKMSLDHMIGSGYMDDPYPNPFADKPAKLTYGDYLKQYGAVNAPVPAETQNLVKRVFLSYRMSDDKWDKLEPLERRIVAHGGEPVWPYAIGGSSNELKPSTILKIVTDRLGEGNVPQASLNIALCQISDVGFKNEASNAKALRDAVVTLLNAGADPDSTHGRRNFREDYIGSLFLKSKEVSDAIRSADARLMIAKVPKLTINTAPAP